MPRHVPTQGPPRSLVRTSPPRRQHRNEATTGLLRGYYAELLRGYYGATTRLLRGYYEATTRLLPGHYQATTRLLQGYYQEPPARHSASGTAAAAPLVCRRRSSRQLGAGVDDPHTERKISMRPFSMCRTSWPTPKTKHATCPCAAGCRWSASLSPEVSECQRCRRCRGGVEKCREVSRQCRGGVN
jgi:hypothetical protein